MRWFLRSVLFLLIALKHLSQSHARNLLRLFTSLVQDRIKLLVADLPDTLLDRSQKLHRRFRQIAFTASQA